MKTKLSRFAVGLASLVLAVAVQAQVPPGSNGVAPQPVPDSGATLALAGLATVGIALVLRARARKK